MMALLYSKNKKKTGGNVWESNPPKRLLTPHTSFED